MANPSSAASEPDTSVRALVYDAFISTGRSISRSSLARQLGLDVATIDASLERLAVAHMLVRQPESGEVLMANPFSAVPTGFRVESASLGWWANCIWDGLGVCAMVGVDATILTSCPDCGEAMSVQIRGSQLDNAMGLVHFAVPAAHWWDDIVFT